MQHRHGDDEREVEPVGHIDMRFVTTHDRPDKHNQIADPDDGQPDIDVPFGLGILLASGNPHQIAGCRQHDEQLVTPEYEPGERRERQPRATSPLDDIIARRDQRIAAKRKNNRRRVKRTQSPKCGELAAQVEQREGQLQSND